MTLTINNIEKENQISKNEFDQVSSLLYGSIVLSNKDNTQNLNEKTQTLDFLIAFLNDYLNSHEWESDESEIKFIDFLSKLQLQKEVLQIMTSEKTLSDIKSSIRTFEKKNEFAIGMR
jgi:predicted MPP superfamily phosphohydrolase